MASNLPTAATVGPAPPGGPAPPVGLGATGTMFFNHLCLFTNLLHRKIRKIKPGLIDIFKLFVGGLY